MKEFDVLIKGRVVLENEVKYCQIGVTDGIIQKITNLDDQLEGKEELDFGKSYVMPGAVDPHVHCFSNPNEGFLKTSELAAAGGVTTFMDMPYDYPDPINHVDILKEKVEILEKEAVVDIGLWATISKWNGTGEIVPLAEAGAMAFKMSTFETDEYRFPRVPDNEVMKAMNILKDLGILAAFHSENDEIIKSLKSEYEDQNKVYARAHMETRPPVAESTSVLNLMELAHWTRARLHIVHVSHPRTLELIKNFKEQGVNITCETCYPYLLLDVNDLEKYGPKAKMNPPLRSPEDVDGMWEHFDKGDIDFITSDHVAWEEEKKAIGNDNIFKAAAGLPGLEVVVPLMFNEMISKRGYSVSEFVKNMSQQPAETFGIKNKGKISEGYDADFVVIDPNKTWKIKDRNMLSRLEGSPFSDQEIKGDIVQTIVRGQTVYDGTNVVGKPGYGKFLEGVATKN